MSDYDSDDDRYRSAAQQAIGQRVPGQTLGGQINAAQANHQYLNAGLNQQATNNAVRKTRTLDELEKRLDASRQQADTALETLREGLKRLNGQSLAGLSAALDKDAALDKPEALIERLHLSLDRLDDLLRRCQTAAETLSAV